MGNTTLPLPKMVELPLLGSQPPKASWVSKSKPLSEFLINTFIYLLSFTVDL